MKAAVLQGVEDLVIKDIPEPQKVPPGHVKVAVKAVGICGSDVHYYREGAIGSFVLRDAMVLGHEVGGIVVEAGSGTNIPIGSVVALEPGIPCGVCPFCRAGQYNLCAEMKFFATPPVDGAMTQFVVHPSHYTHVATGLSPEQACLAEPLSVGIYATRQSSIHIGDKVAILGAGAVGLLTALSATSEGGEVTVYDIQEKRVQLGVEMGLHAKIFSEERDSVAYDVVIDCTGNKEAILWAQRAVRRGGKLVLVGMGKTEHMRIDGLDLTLRGISVHGIFRYANTFPAALRLIKQHQNELSIFTRQQIHLEDLPSYLRENKQADYLKTIVMID